MPQVVQADPKSPWRLVKVKNIDAWLNPDPRKLSDLYAILDDRQRPGFEHRLAA